MRENRPPVSAPAARPPEAAPDGRLAGVVATLERGIEAVLADEGFAAYLRMLSRFHAYSYANTILIMSQRPDATRVNSYNRWQDLGRQVRTGEQGIKIFYPRTQTVEDPDTGEPGIAVVGFGVGAVFDITQTDGEPLPEPPTVADLADSDERSRQLNLRLSRWLIDEGLRLESKVFPGSARGFYLPHGTPKAIVIRKDAWEDVDGEHPAGDPLRVGKTKTLVHEAAHYVADRAPMLARGDVETVAESAAFVVMDRFGLDTAGYSFPYVAGWARNRDVLKRNLGEIQRVSHDLIAAIEGDTESEEHAGGRFPADDGRLAIRERGEWEGPR